MLTWFWRPSDHYHINIMIMFTVNPLLSPPSQISPPSPISPPFQRRKVNKPPLSIKPPPLPLPQSLFFIKKLTINVDWSVMVYSGWKFILFLVFGPMTSNFICLTFSTLRSSSLWRTFLKNKNFVFVTFRLPQVK